MLLLPDTGDSIIAGAIQSSSGAGSSLHRSLGNSAGVAERRGLVCEERRNISLRSVGLRGAEDTISPGEIKTKASVLLVVGCSSLDIRLARFWKSALSFGDKGLEHWIWSETKTNSLVRVLLLWSTLPSSVHTMKSVEIERRAMLVNRRVSRQSETEVGLGE